VVDNGHPEAINDQLERILAKPPMASSPSLSRFLRFIVGETVAGRTEGITEHTLGVRVFNRGEEFNSRMDPIVRVQAHHLRARLTQYYAGPGSTDPLVIELPSRTYVPVFRSAQPVAQAAEAFQPQAVEPPHKEQALPAKMRGPIVVTAVVAIITVAALASLWRAQASARHVKTRHDPNPVAQDLYIRGRYLLDRQTEPALRQSIDCFQQSAAKDPDFAPAFAGLADAYDMLAQYGYDPPREAMEQGRRAAEHALSIDPDLAEAHVALAAILEAYDWNWSAAEREYRRAIELNPALPAAHLWYGMFLRDQGRTKEALPELRRAEQLQPLSVLASMNLGYTLQMTGDSSGALEQARRVVELDPDWAIAHIQLAMVYGSQSPVEAEASLARALTLATGNPHALSVLACTYAHLGKREEGLRIQRELEKLAAQRYVSPFDLGNVSLVLGDQDRAATWLEEAYREHSAGLIFLRNEKADTWIHSPRLLLLINKLHAG